MNFNHRNRAKTGTPTFGYTAREIAYMRSLSEIILEGFIATLNEIHALPEAS